MNSVILMGRLTNDPEIKETRKYRVAYFTVAVDRNYPKETKEKRIEDDLPVTDFIRVVAFDGVADIVETFARKGKRILINGKLEVSSYDDGKEKKFSTNVIANKIEIIDFPDVEEKRKNKY